MSVPRTFDHDECRALFATGEWTQTALAEKYGVSPQRVHQIVDPERHARYIARSTNWCRENYHQSCRECGKRVWKRGNDPAQTGLCLTCWGLTQRTAEHGTESRYSAGCRCDECRAASARARRERRANDPSARAKDTAYRRRLRAEKRAA